MACALSERKNGGRNVTIRLVLRQDRMTRSTHARTMRVLAKEYGATLDVTGGSHYRLRLPSGAVVFAPGTPSDWRALRNLRANLRRAAGEKGQENRQC